TKAGVLMTLPSVINYVVNSAVDPFLDPKDRYSERPQAERDMYWILPPVPGLGWRPKIPKPYNIGWYFTTMPEHFLDFVKGHDADAWEKFKDSFIRQVLPPFIPTIA